MSFCISGVCFIIIIIYLVYVFFYIWQTKAARISVRGAGEAGLQEEVQADSVGHGVERSFAAADAAGDEAGIHAVFRPQYGALYNIPVLREPGVFIFQRVKLAGG